ncbi:hypothetical protein MES5069_440122 [Mesorhizobium escarrei]|uniref:Uncharacterized protein n=1 Tax=Mesorhizobium escarrei TaxID=666018 RepID=A0ABN8K812_9HYPH|nr:hypothetical protein MES5069_440122 [Mesorhizobium escarrei]
MAGSGFASCPGRRPAPLGDCFEIRSGESYGGGFETRRAADIRALSVQLDAQMTKDQRTL